MAAASTSIDRAYASSSNNTPVAIIILAPSRAAPAPQGQDVLWRSFPILVGMEWRPGEGSGPHLDVADNAGNLRSVAVRISAVAPQAMGRC